MQIGERFGLSAAGVSCDESGVSVAGVPLLVRAKDASGHWRSRPVRELNRDLSKRYGVPLDLPQRLMLLPPLPVRLAATT